MKKLIPVLVITAMLVFSCQEEKKSEPVLNPDEYVIEVSGKGIFNGIRSQIYIDESRGRPFTLDTAMFVNEIATFKGILKEPRFVQLSINGVEGSLQFVLGPGLSKIEAYKDSLQTSVISGNDLNAGYMSYRSAYDELRKNSAKARRDAIRLRNSSDTTGYQSSYNTSVSLNAELEAFNDNYVLDHGDEEFALILLESEMKTRPGQELDLFLKKYEAVKQHLDKHSSYKRKQSRIERYIERLEAIAQVDIGNIAPDFTAPTPDGKTLSLSDIRGKATIIDFWASWCGPCRRENPNVVRIYNKYHDKGLEIISVSLDRHNMMNQWLEAIEKDKLNWHHVSNLKYFQDPIALTYNVSAIPATFILDEEGRIVAKKLRGKALEAQIASMLD
ncbi:MAG: AhpC/TSA family protein [Bacteroidia bacterium]|nr:AhpC/TSA family protein [Bacteroidia bacterium]